MAYYYGPFDRERFAGLCKQQQMNRRLNVALAHGADMHIEKSHCPNDSVNKM